MIKMSLLRNDHELAMTRFTVTQGGVGIIDIVCEPVRYHCHVAKLFASQVDVLAIPPVVCRFEVRMYGHIYSKLEAFFLDPLNDLWYHQEMGLT